MIRRDQNIDNRDESISHFQQRQEREQLYEAYNLLHTLAQDFHKPFDAPAVLVVGHQSSGKSALIEALMGFQFNQVGGGTKTRRPVALRMQYNARCTTPLCFLTLENGKEEQRTLSDIQAYIEAENKRLERDPTRCFDSREINIRMEYRFCPNMIVIDTPGMLHPPKGRQMTAQQKALAQASKEAEALVLAKLRCQDYIILCVEDTTDWKHATTRNIVMQADPDLTRTVLVTTKLDTKLPQFSEISDLEDFLRAPLVHRLYPHMLGGPFFTSVPSGRVGLSQDYGTNDAFVSAVKEAEAKDRGLASQKLGLLQSRSCLQHVGISRLRSFLETQVEDCYRRNVAKIVPLLQTELRAAESKLSATEEELSALSLDRLKKGANLFRELFSKELANAIHGSVKASPEDWGETLDGEQQRGGCFLDQEQIQSHAWQQLIEQEVGGVKQKLFGGAQYHRAMKEFTIAARHMRTPVVTEDEIANAAGMGDVHDGANFMRAACVIAVEKAQSTFDPMLEALRERVVHIMRRLYPVVQHMLRQGGAAILQETHTKPFQQMVRRIYDKFIDEQIKIALEKCRDDLRSMTRYITWDMDGRGPADMFTALPTPKRMVQVYAMALDKDRVLHDRRQQQTSRHQHHTKKSHAHQSIPDQILREWSAASGPVQAYNMVVSSRDTSSCGTSTMTRVLRDDDTQMSDYYDLMQLTEEMLTVKESNRTAVVVTALVQHISRSWRNHFAKVVSMKFNCFFLLPFVDDFPFYLRTELDKLYDSGVGEMFDIVEARQALQAKRAELLAECDANSKLQRRFDQINAQLKAAAARNRAEDEARDIEVPVNDESGGGSGSGPHDQGGDSSNASSSATSNNVVTGLVEEEEDDSATAETGEDNVSSGKPTGNGSTSRPLQVPPPPARPAAPAWVASKARGGVSAAKVSEDLRENQSMRNL